MIIFCVILTFVTGSGSTPWQGPVNSLVVAGSPVNMTCQTPSSFEAIDWYYTAFGSSQRSLINEGARVMNSFTEFQVSGNVPGQILTLHEAQMKHGGQYACTALMKLSNVTGTLVESTALLVVLESKPVCILNSTQVKVGREIEMSCSVNFSGPFPPDMEWKQHRARDDSDGGSVIRDGQIKDVLNHNTLTSTRRITADISRHNSTYSCRTYFKLPSKLLDVNATNAPDYNYTWTSPSVQVIYGPSEVAVVPKQDVFYPGDVLTCVADASPSPEFEWRSQDAEIILNGPVMVIRNSMIREQPYVFQCHTTHVLTGSKLASPLIQFTVKNSRCMNTTVANTNLWIIFALVSVCVIIVVAFSLHVVYLKRRIGASLNGQIGPRNDVVVLAANNNEPVYSEYTEIPSYSVCREAMERCNVPVVSNLGYLPMEKKSNSTIRRAVPEAPANPRMSACKENAYQNNEYMTTNDDVLGDGYAVSASPQREFQPIADETNDTYLDLSQRVVSSSTDYAALSLADEEQQLLPEKEQPSEPEQTDEKTEEQNDYLVPLPD